MTRGVLDDVLILDFSTLLPGPMASLFLAEAGAEVIKIERPGHGDEMRHYDPQWGDDSVNFALLNRGKKSLAVDLKDPQQLAQLHPLIQRADVIIEQFRPGVMDRLGLGYQDLREIKADIIYCAITGYGQSGPKKDVAGHDLNYIGDTGLLSLGFGTAERPVVPPALIADIAGGAWPAVMNILLALRHRDRTGQGSQLDIAMTDGLFPFVYWAMGNGQADGDWPGSGDALVTGGSPRYQLYPTADRKVVAAAPIEQRFWQLFCEAINLPAAYRDDTQNAAATREAVAAIIAARPASHWQQLFALADCCCSIVQSVQQALEDEHFQQRGLFHEKLQNADGESINALPMPLAAPFRATMSKRAPTLASHNDEYLK